MICTIEDFLSDDRREKALIIRQGGGVGMILNDHNAKDFGFQFAIPTTLIGQDALEELQAYTSTEKWVLKVCYKGEKIFSNKLVTLIIKILIMKHCLLMFYYVRNPKARIYPTITVVGTKPAPEVAIFSSMGPNIITPDIIKASLQIDYV